MKNKQLSALEIIEETVKYYSKDVTRRAVDDTGGCYYRDENGGKCGVGRCMNNKADFDFQGSVDFYEEQILENGETLDDHLFPRYRGNNKKGFWMDIQGLHDNESYWDEKGLTSLGKEYVERLKRKHATI